MQCNNVPHNQIDDHHYNVVFGFVGQPRWRLLLANTKNARSETEKAGRDSGDCGATEKLFATAGGSL